MQYILISACNLILIEAMTLFTNEALKLGLIIEW